MEIVSLKEYLLSLLALSPILIPLLYIVCDDIGFIISDYKIEKECSKRKKL